MGEAEDLRVISGTRGDTEECPGPSAVDTFKFEEEQNGEGKEEGLKAGKGPARLAHTGSLALLRAVVLTLRV